MSNFWDDDAVDVPAQPAAPAAHGDSFWEGDAVDVLPRAKMAPGTAFVHGAAQGATLGTIDEAQAGLGAVWDKLQAALGNRGDISLSDAYDTRLKPQREELSKAQADHPYLYAGGNVAGTLGSAAALAPVRGIGLLMNPAKAETALGRVATAATGGAVAGAGSSTARPSTPDGLGDLATDVKNGALLGGAFQGGFEALPAAAELAKKGGKKLLSALGGVSGKNIDAYLANPQAIRAAPELEEIKDLVDARVSGIHNNVDDTRHALQTADDQATQAFANTRERIQGELASRKDAHVRAWQAKLEEMTGKRVPIELARDVVQRLEGESATLGTMSGQADEALAASGKSYRKADLLGHADAVGAGAGEAAVGEGKVEALSRFKGLRDRIEGAYGDELSGEELRDMMRQVRDDTNHDVAAGTRSAPLDKLRKGFTGRVSDVLKEDVPEYGRIMGEMKPRSDVLGEMSQHFGDQAKALSSLETIAGGKGARATYLKDLVSRFEQATGQKGVMDKLAETVDARRVLGSPASKDAMRAALPEARQVSRAQAALEQFDPRRTRAATDVMVEHSPQKAALDSALEARQSVEGWSPASTESRLKSVMSGRSIENRKSIEALSARTGMPFGEMLQNRAVADAFDKGYMHGSRNVNLWSIVGSLFGGKAMTGNEPLLKLFGAGFGGVIDQAGPKMTQKALDAFMGIRNSKYLPVLEKAAKRGGHALAVTHALLSQQDPGYRALFEDKAP